MGLLVACNYRDEEDGGWACYLFANFVWNFSFYFQSNIQNWFGKKIWDMVADAIMSRFVAKSKRKKWGLVFVVNFLWNNFINLLHLKSFYS